MWALVAPLNSHNCTALSAVDLVDGHGDDSAVLLPFEVLDYRSHGMEELSGAGTRQSRPRCTAPNQACSG